MKWIMGLLLLSAAFATDFVNIVNTDVGYLDVSGVNVTGGVYELDGAAHAVRAEVTKQFIVLNYSVHLNPRNLERIAGDFDVPLSGTTEIQAYPGEFEQAFELPEIVCGDYRIEGEAYYGVNGTVERFGDSITVRVPCRDFKSRVVSGLFSILPYPLLKMIAGWAGFHIG